MKSVWVFHGINGRFTSGVFDDKKIAEKWIFEQNLTGILTWYPINVGVYEWSIDNGHFAPKKEDHKTPEYIGKFSSASQEHYHYTNGRQEA
jgi:hypothetical protein